MNRARADRLLPWLALALWTGACGPVIDGGPVGTGISTQVAGNVVLVEDPAGLASATRGPRTASPADATDEEPGISGVVVSLDEDPALSTVTDATGRFELAGTLEGDVHLRFSTAEFETAVTLVVTAGATLILSDIVLSPSGVSSDAIQAFAQTGRIAALDCAAATLRLDTGAARTLDVAVADDADITRGDVSITCDELTSRQTVRVSGFLSPDDLTLEAFRIDVGRPAAPEPGETHMAQVRGRLAAIDCDRGVLALDDGRRLQRLLLLPATTLINPAGTSLACDDLAIGATLAGRGLVRVANPGRVELSNATVGAATAGPELRFGGIVTQTDCTSGLVLLVRGSLRQRILVHSATAGLPTGGCAALPVGAWIDGHGAPLAEQPHVVLAEVIRLRRPAAPEPRGRR